MRVFGREIKRGEKAFFTVPVGQLAFQSWIQTPVIVVNGSQDGPVFWINGTVHGDELNGSYAAWELAREMDPERLSGTIVATPISNPMAFADRNKVSAIDGMNMDTAFPGDAEGLLTQRAAKIIYDEIREHADALISFHTMATPYKAEPYSVRKIVPGVSDEVNRRAGELQRVFGVKANCVVDLAGPTNELPGVTVGALDITALLDGIPSFMAEMGQGGKLDPAYVADAKRGLRNILVYLNMTEGTISDPGRQIKITKRRFLRTDGGGFMRALVRSGDMVKAGDPLFEIHYFGEEVKTVPVRQDSYIIGIRENPVVNTGDRTAFVGTEWSDWT